MVVDLREENGGKAGAIARVADCSVPVESRPGLVEGEAS
jgi:hypothetical protein